MNLRRLRQQKNRFIIVAISFVRMVHEGCCFTLLIHLQLFSLDENQCERPQEKKNSTKENSNRSPFIWLNGLNVICLNFQRFAVDLTCSKSFISCTSLNANLIILTDGFAIIVLNALLCVRSMNNLLECFFSLCNANFRKIKKKRNRFDWNYEFFCHLKMINQG